MKIVTYNINGIRAGIKKGFIEWLQNNDYDIVCLQEVKALEAEIPCDQIKQLGYTISLFAANKKGYSGVAILSKLSIKNLTKGNGFAQSDFEGRVIQAEYDNFLLINTYFPSGSSGDERQFYKEQFLKEYLSFIQQKQKQFQDIIILGDFNICHRPIDIHDPVSNKNSSGFLPQERAWMDDFFSLGFVDSLRQVNPHPHQYTWWSYRANAKQNNKGWRIDYIALSASLKSQIRNVSIAPELPFSDHCPVILEL